MCVDPQYHHHNQDKNILISAYIPKTDSILQDPRASRARGCNKELGEAEPTEKELA